MIWSRHQNDSLAIADDVLSTRLAETIAWCEKVLKRDEIDASMRTANTSPPILHEGYDDAVCFVGSLRQLGLGDERPPVVSSMPSLRGGRLLCFFPDENLTDGAAQVESDYFFDQMNIPPWDTWIGYFSDGDRAIEPPYLLSFVPSELVSLANDGISVNPEECIRWIENTQVTLQHRFKS